MSKIEAIEDQIKRLTAGELAAFREWFSKFDAEMWDQQFEADAKSGKLGRMAERALGDHTAGRSTKL